MSNDFTIEKLHPEVWVFKNAFKNSSKIIEYFETMRSDKWEEWEIFGTQNSLELFEYKYNKFPTKEEFKINHIDKYFQSGKDPKLVQFIEEYVWLFYNTTKQYCKELNVNYENWIFASTDIAKYYPGKGASDDMAMNYHTDHEQDKNDEPGNKFGIACLLYLNDNYEGGEISFKVFNNELTRVVDSFEFRPETGDMIIFPSNHPFYHSVNHISNGSKYLIRNWWRYDYSGSETFLIERENFLSSHTENEWEEYLKIKRASIRQQIIEKVYNA